MKKILVIDDEKDVLSVLEKRLIEAGYLVITADNGNDGLVLAKSKLPDLIILDLVMPDPDGGVVAEKLQVEPKTKDIPVIYLTALLSKDEERRMGYVAAGNLVLAKPYEIDRLLVEIERRIA